MPDMKSSSSTSSTSASSVSLLDTTPSSSPPASIKTKIARSKAGTLLRRMSDLDLRAFTKVTLRRSTQSLPADLGRALHRPGSALRVDPKMQAAIHDIVAHIHRGLQMAAAEDPSMAPGLAVVGKLTRADEVAAFRRLFVNQPGLALSKIIYNATEVRLTPSVVTAIDHRFLTPNARSVLFDALMADSLTANLIKLVSTKRGFLRLGIKMRRAMLYKVTTEGRPPQDATFLSPAETLQASGLLFKKENLTPAQITLDTILMGIGGGTPELVGALLQELFVDDKPRVDQFAATAGIQLAIKMGALMRDKFPQNAFDFESHKQVQITSMQSLAHVLWKSSVIEKVLGKYFTENDARLFVQRIEREGERIVDLATRLAAARSQR